MIGALAVLGAVLNSWVLTLHITSVALTSLRADDGGVVICHQGGVASIVRSGIGGTKPAKKRCPICSGLAVLHFGVLTEPSLSIALLGSPMPAVSQTATRRIADQRPHQIFNRGPPRLV